MNLFVIKINLCYNFCPNLFNKKPKKHGVNPALMYQGQVSGPFILYE